MSQMSSLSSLGGTASSLASLAGTGAQIYSQVRQGQQAEATYDARQQLAETESAARAQKLQADYDAGVLQRGLQLASNVSSADAAAAGSGLQPGDGSAGAVTSGMRQRAAANEAAEADGFNASLAAQPRSLLTPDTSFNDYLQAGRSFGSALQSLIG